MLAAVLNLDKGAGALQKAAGAHLLKALVAGVRGDAHDALPLLQVLVDIVQHLFLLPRADQHVHLAQLLRLLREGLRETAGHCDDGAGVFPFHAVDHLPGLFVPGGGDGAGVDDIDIGVVAAVHNVVPVRCKLLGHNLCLILVHLASQGVKCCSHSPSFPRLSLRFLKIAVPAGAKFPVFLPKSLRTKLLKMLYK